MNFIKILLVKMFIAVFLFEIVSCQFGFPNLFEEFSSSPLRAARDPRQDRGPVLFPQAPIGPDTSGVRVGASGFGFVPPSGRGRAVGAIGGGPNVYNEFPFW